MFTGTERSRQLVALKKNRIEELGFDTRIKKVELKNKTLGELRALSGVDTKRLTESGQVSGAEGVIPQVLSNKR